MKFFMLDNSEETREIAPILQPKFADSKKEKPIDFTQKQKNAFANLSLNDLVSTAWLGHSNTRGIGDYDDAAAFVNKFNKDFEAQFKGKDKKLVVEHIYLVGCETALEHKESTLAQRIADQLFKMGFKNIKIHAIANPPAKNVVAMRVKIVSQAGVTAITGGQAGDVQAFLLTAAQDEELTRVESEIAKEADLVYSPQDKKKRSPAQIKADNHTAETIRAAKNRQGEIERDAIVFLNTSNIKVELDRSENTFIPNQPHLRKKKDLQKEQVHMEVVKAIKVHLMVASEPNRKILKSLLENVEKEKSGDWRKVITDKIQEMHNGNPAVRLFRDGIMIDILKNILSKAPSQVELVEENPKEKQKGKNSALKPTKVKPANEKPKEDKKDKSSILGAVGEGLNRVKNAFGGGASGSQPTVELKTITKKDYPINLEMQTAINNIDAFVAILKQELKNRPNLIKNLFPSAKQVKVSELEKLSKAMSNLYQETREVRELKRNDWVALLDTAETEDKIKKGAEKGLMAHRLSDRTVNLFQNIREGHPERGILKPVKSKVGEKYEAEKWTPPKTTRRFL